MPNKILIITYYWPPSGGPGVQRWLKFVKYLPKYNIEPIVLTVDENFASYPQLDKSLSDNISDSIKVYKTKSFEILSVYKFFSKKKQIPYSGFTNEKKTSSLKKISAFVRGNLLIPDARKGWNKYAYKEAVKIIETHNIKTVITTSPPHSTQLIGLKLKKNFNINWIADLRDPWTDIFYYDKFYPTFFSKKIDLSYEKNVLTFADNIVTVSNSMKEEFVKKHRLNEAKFKVITNGYDDDDFKNVEVISNDSFTITYTGTISNDYPFNSFLEALKELKKLTIKVKIIGNLNSKFIEEIEKNQLTEKFEFINHVSHEKAISYMQSSDLLLLLIPFAKNSKSIVTGKIFEYMASQKPILGIGPTEGDADLILKHTSSGKLFDFNDVTGISRHIEYHYKNENKTAKSNSKINEYSRRELTKKIISLLS